MRILHLTTQLPSAFGIDGGALRQFELCTRAAQAGHEITVVVPVAPWMVKAYRPAEQLTPKGIRLVTTARRSRREVEALSAIARRPSTLFRLVAGPYYGVQAEMFAMDMREAIRAQVALKPDVVTIEHDFAIRLGDDIPAELPMVLMTHNVTSSYYHKRAESTSGVRRMLLNFQSRRMESYVNSRLSDITGIVTVSGNDADLFRAVTDVPISIVPNGTALEPAQPRPTTRSPEILFTGTMSYAPNREGILWFASEIWPHIVRQIPNARLLVVGRWPDARVRRLQREDTRIEVTGAVTDMSPYYERAMVVVAPLLSGGGTRLKILDALASARPVVSTEIGAQGLGARDGEHLILVDEPRAFAQQVVRLTTDAELRSRLSASGRRLIDESYHWQAISVQYIEALSAMISHTK